MEKIEKLLGIFKKLDIDSQDYIIFGSGPLAIRGLKEPKDLDVMVRKGVYENVKNSNTNWKEVEVSPGKFYMENDIEFPGVEFYDSWGPGNWDFDELFLRSEIIENFRFASMNDVLEYKQRNWEDKKREKDFQDLQLVMSFLKDSVM